MLMLSSFAQAQLCLQWSDTTTIGYLDVSQIDEASGIAQSALNSSFYHFNDSDYPFGIYQTNEQGSIVAQAQLTLRFQDVEDADIAPCGTDSCLFLADMGDNHRNRKTIDVYFVKELDLLTANPQLEKRSLGYPDGAHDAESFAIHPNGDLYILTKEPINLFKTQAARLYKLDANEWQNPSSNTLELSFVTSIDLFELSGSSFDVFSHIATSMDFSANGETLVILTYGDAFELDFTALLQGDLKAQKISLDRSVQQEAISYTNSGLIYTSEGRLGEAPVKKLECLVR